MPPQIPNFSPLASAYSRQSSRTTQPLQTSLASRVDAPRSGKNRSGSTPMQLAYSCQLRSSPSRTLTRFIGSPPSPAMPPMELHACDTPIFGGAQVENPENIGDLLCTDLLLTF